MTPLLFLLAPLYALANRFAGGGLGWDKLKHDAGGPLHGHPVVYAGLGAILAGLALGAVQSPPLWAPLAVMGLGWAIGRSIVFGKDWTTPDTVKEIILTLAHHALVAVAGVAVGVWFHLPLLGICVAAWAIAATALAVWYGLKETAAIKAGRPLNPKFNIIVEAGQGALLGLAIGAGALAGQSIPGFSL